MSCIFCTAASSREPLTPTTPGFSRALVFHLPCARYRQQGGLGLEALPRAVLWARTSLQRNMDFMVLAPK